VTPSHAITREWREYERANTTVLSSYVQPIIIQYLDRLEQTLAERDYDCPLFVMQSNGGTASFESAKRHPITLIESGPAAGVKGAALISKLCNEPNVIYLDIGGTTAKCSTIRNHEVTITTEYKLEWTRLNFGYPVRSPVVDLVEIGAGGGSIAWFNAAGLLQVGPTSAGGDPGPACYGLGGSEPTVTDAKLVTGVINPASFAGGQFELQLDKAEQAIAKVAARLDCTVEQAAVAIIRLVDANMINALKLVSIQRGHDPREFSLVVGGGGGPMHAAQLARELGVKEVIVPLYPGLFSAWGMLATEQRRDFVRSRLSLLRDTPIEDVARVFAELEEEAVAYFTTDEGAPTESLSMSLSCDLRYLGQEHTVTVPVASRGSDAATILANFHDMHEKTYTFRLPDTEVELVTYRLKAEAHVPRPEIKPLSSQARSLELARKPNRMVNFGEAGTHDTAIFDRDLLPPGFVGSGPMVIEEPTSTTIVLPGQQILVDNFGFLRITEGIPADREGA
jgi:N-methylhydantoinase A